MFRGNKGPRVRPSHTQRVTLALSPWKVLPCERTHSLARWGRAPADSSCDPPQGAECSATSAAVWASVSCWKPHGDCVGCRHGLISTSTATSSNRAQHSYVGLNCLAAEAALLNPGGSIWLKKPYFCQFKGLKVWSTTESWAQTDTCNNPLHCQWDDIYVCFPILLLLLFFSGANDSLVLQRIVS